VGKYLQWALYSFFLFLSHPFLCDDCELNGELWWWLNHNIRRDSPIQSKQGWEMMMRRSQFYSYSVLLTTIILILFLVLFTFDLSHSTLLSLDTPFIRNRNLSHPIPIIWIWICTSITPSLWLWIFSKIRYWIWFMLVNLIKLFVEAWSLTLFSVLLSKVSIADYPNTKQIDFLRTPVGQL
jgi:hypothetical protein